jgi:predicted dehydrogenase
MTQQPQASSPDRSQASRRAFLQTSGSVAAATALAGAGIPRVHAGEENTIRLALIGCGGRGSGAVRDAIDASQGPIKLHAMADVQPGRLAGSLRALQNRFADKIDVPPERQFVGFDAYKKAIDSLRPGDVAMLTGYVGWRPVQLEYAIEKGMHVFMEKSFGCDPPAVRRIIAAQEAADKKNLKVAAGLMCRHSLARQQLIDRIRDGVLGEIRLIRAYRMQPVGPLGQKPENESELVWQFRNFTKFFWVSGGLFAEMTIHQIDEVCWLADAMPITAHGIGGRSPSNDDPSQNLDSYHIEYTFANGAKAVVDARYLSRCHNEFATYVHGTKAAAQFSGDIHAPTVRIYKDQRIEDSNIVWQPEPEPYNPYHTQWSVLLDAIRNDKPCNESKRAGLSNMADIMGRAAVHSGNITNWEQTYASEFQWCPDLDQMDYDTPPPVQADQHGRYPCPSPGFWTEL